MHVACLAAFWLASHVQAIIVEAKQVSVAQLPHLTRCTEGWNMFQVDLHKRQNTCHLVERLTKEKKNIKNVKNIWKGSVTKSILLELYNTTFVCLIKFSIHQSSQKACCFDPQVVFQAGACVHLSAGYLKISWFRIWPNDEFEMLWLPPWCGHTIKNTSTPWASDVWPLADQFSGTQRVFFYSCDISLFLFCVALWVRLNVHAGILLRAFTSAVIQQSNKCVSLNSSQAQIPKARADFVFLFFGTDKESSEIKTVDS